MRFSYEQTSVRDVRVLHLAGDLDAESAPQLRGAVDELLAGESGPLVIVDLARVHFLDSAGLTVLEDAHHRAAAGSTRLEFAAPPRAVTRLFEITGLDDRFAIHADVGQAVAAPGE